MAIDADATLLERERELEELRRALTEAQRAHGQFVLVAGERLYEGVAALSKGLFAQGGAAQLAASADSAFSMLHGLYWLVNNLATTEPVALWVDDLHWSDTESLRFLNYLAPRLDGDFRCWFSRRRALKRQSRSTWPGYAQDRR